MNLYCLILDYLLKQNGNTARGGLGMSPYPWGGPYTRNMKGCFLSEL